MHRHFWGLLNILSINFHHHVLFNRTISYRSCGINFQSIPKPLRLCGFGKVGLFPLASAACHLLSGVIRYSSFYEFARAAAAGLTCDVSFLRHYNQQVTTLKVHLLRHYTSVPQKKNKKRQPLLVPESCWILLRPCKRPDSKNTHALPN